MTHDEDFTPVWIHLDSSLDAYDEDHERFYAPPADATEEALHKALNDVSAHALDALQGGSIPTALDQALAQYEPWEPVDKRIMDLLGYVYVRKRVELDIAREAVGCLYGLDKRVQIARISFLLLQRAGPAPTAYKYLRQALRLYLAGYTSEVFIMCGAVLESAMAVRFTDAALAAAGVAPKFSRAGSYSIKQRMDAERKAPIFSPQERDRFWKVVNWRNDVAHVQLDITPDPALAVLEVASLLGLIMPKNAA